MVNITIITLKTLLYFQTDYGFIIFTLSCKLTFKGLGHSDACFHLVERTKIEH